MKLIRYIRSHSLTLLVFWLILFRPQILAGIRHGILRPMEKIFHHQPVRKFHRPPTNIHFASFKITDPNADNTSGGNTNDGCGNSDNGDCSSTDNSADNTDTSSNDGCSDQNDESCASDNNPDYTQAPYDNSADGCDCSGGTLVGSSSQNNFFNETLVVQVTSRNFFNLYITDADGNLVTYLAKDTSVQGTFTFTWYGNYGDGQFIPYGTYHLVIADQSNRHTTAITYSSQHGFQVEGTSSNVVALSF